MLLHKAHFFSVSCHENIIKMSFFLFWDGTGWQENPGEPCEEAGDGGTERN